MIDSENDDDGSGAGLNIWISFADLFAGLLLITLLGLVTILPHYKEVRFSRDLVETVNQATRTTKLIEERLGRRLPPGIEQPRYSETEIIIPSAALFKSFGFDDFQHDREKADLLDAIRTSVHEALDEAGGDHRFLTVIIEGHTDSDPIRRDHASPAITTNWELSSRRATGVLRFFEDGGLDPKEYNIVAMGLADTQPVADNTTDEGKAKNRRIVIRIEPNLPAIMRSRQTTQSGQLPATKKGDL